MTSHWRYFLQRRHHIFIPCPVHFIGLRRLLFKLRLSEAFFRFIIVVVSRFCIQEKDGPMSNGFWERWVLKARKRDGEFRFRFFNPRGVSLSPELETPDY